MGALTHLCVFAPLLGGNDCLPEPPPRFRIPVAAINSEVYRNDAGCRRTNRRIQLPISAPNATRCQTLHRETSLESDCSQAPKGTQWRSFEQIAR
jgi:hypothetical protein